MRPSETATTTPKNESSQAPMADCVNECTESSTPERVRNVPRIVRENVASNSDKFHTRSIPRRSCTITEWMYAVPVSHGRNDAFSTGSQPQTPPHPRTSYDHQEPSMIPTVRKPHANNVQRRVSPSQP